MDWGGFAGVSALGHRPFVRPESPADSDASSSSTTPKETDPNHVHMRLALCKWAQFTDREDPNIRGTPATSVPSTPSHNESPSSLPKLELPIAPIRITTQKKAPSPWTTLGGQLATSQREQVEKQRENDRMEKQRLEARIVAMRNDEKVLEEKKRREREEKMKEKESEKKEAVSDRLKKFLGGWL
jgi:hypothetical protein